MTTADVLATGVDDASLRSLRRWNTGLALLHLAQAVVVVVLARDFAATVTRSLPTGPPGTTPSAPEALFDVPVGVAVAAFLAFDGISALIGIAGAIAVSLFVFFNGFALNQWLQYGQVGPWRSYAFGEKGYVVLSLVAKSVLAWQIFAASLAS